MLHAAGDLPIGATVVFSSVAGRFGNAGQTDYSAANDLLCKVTSSFRRTRPGTRRSPIDWTAWGGIGMATRGSTPKIMEMAGVEMLPPEAGIAWIRRELTTHDFRGEVVVAGALGRLAAGYHPTGGVDPAAIDARAGAFPGEVAEASLRDGLVVRATLDPAAQPFLDDHRIDGTPVLPGVMGMEAFAEVARLLAPEQYVVAVEDVDFLTPVKFYRDEPRTLTISARIRPDGSDLLAECRLEAERQLPGTDLPQRTVHFTGSVRLSAQRPTPGEDEPRLARVAGAPAIAPADVYRLYFHGPAYQVVAEAWHADGAAAGRLAEHLPVDHQPAGAPTLLGPRLEELCFQVAGLWEAGHEGRLALPAHVDRLTVLGELATGEGEGVVALARPVAGESGRFDCDVRDADGRVLLRLDGYRTVPLPGPVADAGPAASERRDGMTRAESSVNAITRLGIVNRGEPAMRLLTAVAELNRDQRVLAGPGEHITTVALYTDPDSDAWFVQEADEAVPLGSATYLDPRDGHRKSRYLDEAGVVSALVQARCDAVWVGWGFVSERASFAQRCEEAGLVFVGPDSATIRALGDKVTAKRLAEKADVPVVPWGGGAVDGPEQAAAQAARLGYPVVLKAAAGGGGRGIRVVRSEQDLTAALASARGEAELAFGDPAVFLERFVEAARHVEVQVIADSHGTTWAVGVRDCSIQRRNQKVIEESGSTVLDGATEAAIRAAAVRLATAVGYRNAGTVEFLVDPTTREFMFMEVNARLQVEHPVTEATTGLDLVKLQLRVAAGGRLEGEPPPVRGHAVEARLCAEDPENGFVPAPGRIAMLRLPTGSGVRIDSGVREGDTISAEFDSMIAKIVAWGQDRDEALARLRRALAQSAVVVEGGTTNRSFLVGLLDRPELCSGDFDNRWLDRLTAAGEHVPAAQPVALLAAAVEAYAADHAAAQAAFHAGARRGRPEIPETVGTRVQLRYAGASYDLRVYRTSPGSYRVRSGRVNADLDVDFVNEYERRIRCAGRHHRVVAVTQGAMFRIVVDGTTHRVTRDDGGVVRAGWPAFVVSAPASSRGTRSPRATRWRSWRA